MHWIFVYFLFSAVVVAIAAYVFPGEPEALLKLADWRGEKCGLSRNRGKPYLYFCPSEHDPDRLQKLACINDMKRCIQNGPLYLVLVWPCTTFGA